MPSYPKINDKDFYNKINKKFKKYTIPKDKGTINQYCKPKKLQLQIPQKFVSEFINPQTPYKGLLVYHRIGSGKTCTAIQVAEKWKHIRNIVIILPASLKGNFRNELRSQHCGNDIYLTKQERLKLLKLDPKDKEFKEIVKKSNDRINKVYTIYSYNKFIDLALNRKLKLKNTLLIIDEVQNMVSETGIYYSELQNIIDKADSKLRIILLSATPMFDKPYEIALTMNLLQLPTPIPIGKEFENTFIGKQKNEYYAKNMKLFKKYIKGFVSYYKGSPDYTFPELKIKYVKCEMSNFQYNAYKSVLNKEGKQIKKIKKKYINVSELPNNFYIGARFVSNIVFPNKYTNIDGFNSLKKIEIIKRLDKYSTKFNKIINQLKKKGKTFIYSSFKEHAGIKSLVKVLEAFGYKNYIKHGPGKKRFAIWSSDENMVVKEEIREIFNRKNNLYGEKLKIILGSPAIKEGVSLKAVKYVHILEPYWNNSRIEQVIGRASRFCSHVDLPKDERIVKINIYMATSEYSKNTVDQYIKKMSDNKNKIIKSFELALKESAIDCNLNKYANNNIKDKLNIIKCDI